MATFSTMARASAQLLQLAVEEPKERLQGKGLTLETTISHCRKGSRTREGQVPIQSQLPTSQAQLPTAHVDQEIERAGFSAYPLLLSGIPRGGIRRDSKELLEEEMVARGLVGPVS